jgi:ABC-2 type transport system permease protein
LLQILYMLPLMFIGFRNPQNAHFVVASCVFIAAMLAGSLAWLTIAAEDAPELVGTAPVAMTRMRYYKAVAACVPVLALLVPLALYWLITNPWNGAVLLFCGVGATFSTALVQVWNPRKGDRRDMKARHKHGNIVSSILEGMASLGWAVLATGLASSWWWLTPIGLVLIPLGLATAWIVGRPKRALGMLA